jgi:hypothetical protein
MQVIIVSRDGPFDSCGKKLFSHHTLFVSYLQFVDRKPLRTELCSNGCGAAAGSCPCVAPQHL